MDKALKDKLTRVGIEFEQTTGLFTLKEKAYLSPVLPITEAGLTASQMPLEIPDVIYPVFRAMTGDKITLNCTLYPKEQLIGSTSENTGLISWVRPYEVPVIMNHQDSPGFFGGSVSEPLGRVIAARYEEGKTGGYLALAAKLSDKSTIKKVLDGRYHTLSIGVSAGEVECSVCGQLLRSQGWCDHEKGETYEFKGTDGVIRNTLCYYIIQNVRAREISFVLTPSDNEAQVVTPDLGEKGLKIWAAKSGTVSTVTEMTSGINKTLAEVLKGFSLSENLQTSPKDTTLMPTPKKSESTPDIDKTPKETPVVETVDIPTPVEPANTDVVENALPVFNSVSELISAALELHAQEDKDPEVVAFIGNAIEAAGLSTKHLYRVELSPTEGVAVIDSTEETKDLEQKTLTVREFITLAETEITDLKAQNVTHLENVNTLTAERDSLKSELDELSTKSEVVLSGEISHLKSELEAEKAKCHQMLATSVAVELKRSNAPLANGKSLEELTAILGKRTEDSLTDTYNDLLTSMSAVAVITPIVPVINPALIPRSEEETDSSHVTSLAKIQALFEKHKTQMVEDVDGKKVALVTETKEEPITIVTNSDGTVSFFDADVNEADITSKLNQYTL